MKKYIAVFWGKPLLTTAAFILSQFYSYSQVSWNIEPSCSGSNTGSIELNIDLNNPLSPAPPFNIVWSDSDGIPIQAEFEDPNTGISIVSGLAIGEYCVFIISLTDGCTSDFCGLVVDGMVIESITPTCICPAPPNASFIPYGAVSVEVVGGNGPQHSFAWTGTGAMSDNTIANPLVYEEGTYSVTVTDGQTGCTVSGEVTVGECQVDLQSLVQVVPDCNEEGTSTLSIQLPTGYGLGPFQFKWVKVGLGLLETDEPMVGSASLQNASPGEYCLTIFTKNGCSAQLCGIEVAPYSIPVITPTVAIPNNGNNGSITLNVTGQPGPFAYDWENGQTTQNRTGLPPGVYSVTVTDIESGCTNTTSVDLKNCTGLFQAINDLEAEVTAMTTVGGQWIGGAINITNVEDQFPGYDFNFLWNNGATTEDIGNLSNGIYSVTVTTSACPGNNAFGDWQLCNFTLSFSQSGMNCNGSTLTVTPAGAGPFTYKWETGATTQSIGGALHGTEYCVTVTTGAGTGCSASDCHTTRPRSLSGVLLLDLQNATFGNSNGSIHVSGINGFAPYGYTWSNGMTGESISGLAPGQYTVTVTDNCPGRGVTATYLIQCEFGPNDLQGTVTNVPCSASSIGGAIEITQLPSFGSASLPVFNWSNGATTQNIDNLSAGNYCVTLTEAISGCVAVRCFEVGISSTADFTISFDENPGCYPLSEGSITANVVPTNPSSPNPGPFSYSWGTWLSGGSPPIFGNVATIEGVPAGWYGVVVTDAMGCTASATTLMWPPAPTSIVHVYDLELNELSQYNPLLLCQGETGTATISVDLVGPNGSPPVSYTWQNGSQYPLTPFNTPQGTLTNIGPGSWSVTVTDASGCQAFAHFNVRTATSRLFSEIKPNCATGTAILLTPTGFGPFTYQWSDGATTKDRTGLTQEETYSVTITNIAGCTLTRSFDIEGVFDLRIYIGADVIDDDCDTECEGSIDMAVENTIPPATYLWSNGETTQDLANVCSGQYAVTISSLNCPNEVTNFEVNQYGFPNCGIINEIDDPSDDGYYHYVLPFLSVIAVEPSCPFDSDCDWHDQFCSEIWINPIDGVLENNCWTGVITITYDNNDGNPYNDPSTQLEVFVDANGFTRIKWISDDNKRWKPDSAGTYDVTVEYEGNGNSSGNDCSILVSVNFFGKSNMNDAIGFDNHYWFDVNGMGVSPNLNDAYFGAWRCGSCDPNTPIYIMENDQDECSTFDNWVFTFFNYTPKSFVDPCNAGGIITILDFNDDGAAVIMSDIVVPADVAVASIPNMQPFFSDANTWCTNSGWCYYNPADIYGPNTTINQLIVASWADPNSCKAVVYDDPNTPNPDPCVEGEEDDCPVGLICYDGNCYQPCEEDDDCFHGECEEVEGIGNLCIENNECEPECPDNQICIDGFCYIDESVCGFFRAVSGQGGYNSYLLNYSGPSTTLQLHYKTYYIEDEISVLVNGTDYYTTGCISTSNNPQPPGPPNPLLISVTDNSTINIVVETCGSSSSKFEIEISCGETLNQQPDGWLVGYPNSEEYAISVSPNPFSSTFNLEFNNFEMPLDVQMVLIDNFGRKVWTRDQTFDTGKNHIAISGVENLKSGLCILLIKKKVNCFILPKC